MYFEIFLCTLHRIMNMHSKYDNMHKNEIIYVVKCTNNHVISSVSNILSIIQENFEEDNSTRWEGLGT